MRSSRVGLTNKFHIAPRGKNPIGVSIAGGVVAIAGVSLIAYFAIQREKPNVTRAASMATATSGGAAASATDGGDAIATVNNHHYLPSVRAVAGLVFCTALFGVAGAALWSGYHVFFGREETNENNPTQKM